MKVIIPAAGYGSRLRPHTFLIPKALLPIANKPLLEYILKQAIEWGGDRFTIIHGHLKEQIESFVHERFQLDVEFRTQEKRLGLGHAILTGIEPEDKDLVILLGDTILKVDLKPVIKRGVTSIGVKEVEDPRKMGVVFIENSRVTQLVEKPQHPASNLAIVGVYYIRDAQLLKKAIQETIDRDITVKGEYQITDALQVMLEWGEIIESFPVDGWYDCGKPETLLETNRYILDCQGGDYKNADVKQSVIVPPVSIEQNTIIERAIIGPYVSIGKDVIIRDAIIRNSIIGDRVIIEQALLDQTLIGNRAEVRQRFHNINLGSASSMIL